MDMKMKTKGKLQSMLLGLLTIFLLAGQLFCDQAHAADPLDTWSLRYVLPQGNNLKAVTFGNGAFVAVGEGGVVLSSSDGATWTVRSSGTAANLYGATYGNGMFVAVGLSGIVLTSPDGATWTSRSSGSPNNLYGVTFGNDMFVAVGYAGAIITSTDGVTWATHAPDSGTMFNYYGVTWGNGTFAAVGYRYDGLNYTSNVLTSADGNAWTSHLAGIVRKFNAITYGNGMFAVAEYLAGDLTQYSEILTSADGIAWTGHYPGVSGPWQLSGVTYNNSTFAAVGGVSYVFTSSDGSSWTPHLVDRNYYLKGVTFGNGTFVAVGDGGVVLQSDPMPVPKVSVSPASHSFGNVPLGSNGGPVEITIGNTGSADLAVSSMNLGGADAGQFSLNLGTCASLTPMVTASGSCTVGVGFAPTGASAKSAYLRIASNDPDNSAVSIPLSGTGVYTVTATVSGGHGSVVSANPVQTASGATASFTLAPAAGYQPGNIVTGDCPAGSFNGNLYTTGAITGDCTASFSFYDPPPDTSITSHPSNPSSSNSFTFTFTASEAGSTFECKLNNGSWNVCTSPYTNYYIFPQCTVCVPDGPITFSVRAKDPAGNYDPTPASYTWSIPTPIVTTYEGITDGGVLALKAIDYTETLTFYRPISFTLRGGYDAFYTFSVGTTALHGAIEISNGTVDVENIAIMP